MRRRRSKKTRASPREEEEAKKRRGNECKGGREARSDKNPTARYGKKNAPKTTRSAKKG